MALCDKDEVTQFDLVDKTGLSAPTVSLSLSKMQNEGIVERESNPEDLRETKVYLTDKGREQMKLINSCCELTELDMMNGFSDFEKKEFERMLKTALNNIKEKE